MTAIQFSAAGILLGFFALLMVSLFGVAMVRAFAWRRRARASEALQPRIRDLLVTYLAGSNEVAELKSFAHKNRRDISEVLLSFQGTVGGSALHRLCELALDLGLVHDWIADAHSRDAVRRRTGYARLSFVCANEPCRRLIGDMMFHALDDADPEVWLWASRAVIQSGAQSDVEGVFNRAVSKNLLVRILLTEALRKYAGPLCHKAVPDILRSDDPGRVLAALDILVAWERAIPVGNLPMLIDHRDRDVRIQALRLAPMVPLNSESRSALVHALSDPDAEVCAAAVLSAGRVHLEEALPSLARLLRLSPAELARSAAEALATMPPRGWQTLEELSANANPVTAAAAEGALNGARRKAAFK